MIAQICTKRTYNTLRMSLSHYRTQAQISDLHLWERERDDDDDYVNSNFEARTSRCNMLTFPKP